MYCSIPRNVQAECSKFCFISESEMFCYLSTVIYALLYSLIVSVSTHTTQPEFYLNSCLTWFEIFSLLCHYQASVLARVFNYVKQETSITYIINMYWLSFSELHSFRRLSQTWTTSPSDWRQSSLNSFQKVVKMKYVDAITITCNQFHLQSSN